MTLSALGIFSAAGAGGAPVLASDYELIATTVLGSTVSSITLSNLGDYSGIYKHLQVRAVTRDNRALTGNVLAGRFNGDTGNNYTGHYIAADGTTVTSFRTAEVDHFHAGVGASANTTANAYRVTVMDILDAYSTTKYKVTRSLSGGAEGTGQSIRFYSGLWLNTASITSVTIFGTSASLVAGTRMSIYGIK